MIFIAINNTNLICKQICASLHIAWTPAPWVCCCQGYQSQFALYIGWTHSGFSIGTHSHPPVSQQTVFWEIKASYLWFYKMLSEKITLCKIKRTPILHQKKKPETKNTRKTRKLETCVFGHISDLQDNGFVPSRQVFKFCKHNFTTCRG